MKLFKNVFSVTLLQGLILLYIPANSATYYVATTGDNNNPGSKSSPWRTVKHAVEKMVEGDTTYVKGGVYSDPPRFSRSGKASALIKLLNAPGEFPVIDCKNIGTKIGVLIMDATKLTNPTGYITIEGFEIRNCWVGIKMYNGHNISLRRNKIHHNTTQGINGNGKNILVDRSVVNHNGQFAVCAAGGRCNGQHGIYTTGPNWTITNNLIYDNLGYGISVAGYGYGEVNQNYTDSTYAGANGWLIANNTIAYNHYSAAISLYKALTTKSTIINNIFYENSQKHNGGAVQGITFVGSGGGHIIKNNLCYATAPGGSICIANVSTGAYKSTGLYTGSGNIVNTLNPLFANAPATLPSSPNFALKSSSPAINRGVINLLTKLDFLGRVREGAYDIGAYEYIGSSSLSAPSSVSNLRVSD